jgi:hypothetical protein
MKFRVVSIFALAVALVGCGLSDEQKADYAQVQRSGVSPAIYDKMVHDDPLSVGDIIALSRARVSDGVIVRYIRDHDTVYYLNAQDYSRLHDGGVSNSVIDFMAHTAPYGPYGAGPFPGYPYPPVSIGVGVGFGGHHW